MSDLISRQAAINAVRRTPYHDLIKENMVLLLMDLPSAKPERKTGHWIVTDGEIRRYKHYKCSECAHEFDWMYYPMFPPVFNYCQKCGARMTDAAD